MTAAELAEILITIPGDAEVLIYDPERGGDTSFEDWTSTTTHERGTRLVLGRPDYYS